MQNLEIKNLSVSVTGTPILNQLNLSLAPGETHAIMGPNGSGKSTLAQVLLGNPKYAVTGGDIFFQGQSLVSLKPEQRARRGLFVSWQHPKELDGVRVLSLLKASVDSFGRQRDPAYRPALMLQFRTQALEKMATLGIEESFLNRYVN